MQNKAIKTLLIVLSIGCIIFCSVKLWTYAQDKQEIQSNITEINEIKSKIKTKTIDMNEIVSQNSVSENTYTEIKPDESLSLHDFYAQMQEINTDYVFYVDIPNSNISYPVVYSKDNEYYLTHDFKNKKNSHGCIFLDNSTPIPIDKPTYLLHGHHMKDKSMFTELSNYKQATYRDEHSRIILTLPEYINEYKVYAVRIVDLTTEEYELYPENLKEKCLYYTEPQSSDNVILSTCDYVSDDARLLVYGYLVNSYE